MAAWTSSLHGDGYHSGVYSSAASGITDLVSRYGTGYLEPDHIWIADWNGQQTVSSPYVPTSEWANHQRIHQYQGGHYATYAGVTMNIDSDYLDVGSQGPSRSPFNLLTSASFGDGVLSGWALTPGANWADYSNGTAHDGAYYLEMNTGSLAGGAASVWQDVSLSTQAGQSFEFSVWLRSADGAPGEACVVLWGLWTNIENGQQCVVLTGRSWTQVTAPLDTHASAHSILRAQLYMETAGVNFDVDGTQLVGAGLTSASFGDGASGWALTPGANWADYRNGTAHDGAYYLEMNTGTRAGGAASLWQDLPLRTKRGQSFDFSVWLRSATGARGKVCVVLWGLWKGIQYGERCVVLIGRSWTQVTAPLDTHASGHSILRAQLYMDTSGVNFDVDGTQLESAGLTSASFGRGVLSGWALTPGANWADYRNGTAHDGAYYLEMNTGSLAGGAASVWQDVTLLTQPGQSFDFSVWLRSADGAPGEVCVVLWGLWTNIENGQQCVVLTGRSWTQVTAALDTHVSGHSILRAQLYMETAGVNFDVDGTTLVAGGAQISPPTAPTAVRATAGDDSAIVSWMPPAENGGGPLVAYTVTAEPGGATVSVAKTVTRVTVTGLTAGANYTFTVAAASSAGKGPPSLSSNVIVPS